MAEEPAARFDCAIAFARALTDVPASSAARPAWRRAPNVASPAPVIPAAPAPLDRMREEPAGQPCPSHRHACGGSRPAAFSPPGDRLVCPGAAGSVSVGGDRRNRRGRCGTRAGQAATTGAPRGWSARGGAAGCDRSTPEPGRRLRSRLPPARPPQTSAAESSTAACAGQPPGRAAGAGPNPRKPAGRFAAAKGVGDHGRPCGRGKRRCRIEELSPGMHSVLIQLKGHRPVRSKVAIVAGEQTKLAVSLERLAVMPESLPRKSR